jgi:hypothetical protein
MRGQWGRADGLGWVDQGGSKPAPLCHGHGRGDGSPDPEAVPSRGLVEEDTMPRRLRHTIRHTEQICRGCWEVRTQTEDGHRFSAFGVMLEQAMSRVHHKAKAYGHYADPTSAAHERREDVAHIIVTFVQDGSRTYHQRCTAAVALSRKAMYCDIWSGESLPPDLRCAACGRTIALPLPTSSDLAEQPGGAWRYVAETCVDRHQEPSAGHTMTPWLLERRTGRQRSRDEPTTHEGCSVRRAID